MPEIKSWIDVAQITVIAVIFWFAADGLAHRIVYTIEWFQRRKGNPDNHLIKARDALVEILEREKERE